MENSIYKISSNIQKTITGKINIFQYIFEQIPVISWNKKEFMTMSDNTTTKDATEVKGNIFFLYFMLKVLKICPFQKIINLFQYSMAVQNENVKEENNQRYVYPWKRAKKVAMMISFSGKDYLGMQRYLFSLIFINKTWAQTLSPMPILVILSILGILLIQQLKKSC